MTSQEVMKREKELPRNLKGRPVMMPAVDVYENQDEYLLLADLPGVLPDDLEVQLEKGELSVQGYWGPTNPGNVLAREFRQLDYRRAFLVPDTIDADAVSATLDDGVLTIHIPKAEAVKPRRIQIRAG